MNEATYGFSEEQLRDISDRFEGQELSEEELETLKKTFEPVTESQYNHEDQRRKQTALWMVVALAAFFVFLVIPIIYGLLSTPDARILAPGSDWFHNPTPPIKPFV